MCAIQSNTSARKCVQVVFVVLVVVLAYVLSVSLNASLDFQGDVGGYDGGCRKNFTCETRRPLAGDKAIRALSSRQYGLPSSTPAGGETPPSIAATACYQWRDTR